VRSFEPTGHGIPRSVTRTSGATPLTVHFSATAIEMVRGVLTTAHVLLERPMSDREIWGVYRGVQDEPFMRIVKEAGDLSLSGAQDSQWLELLRCRLRDDPHSSRVVVMWP